MKHYQNSKNKLTKTFLYLLLIAGLFFINLMNAEGAGCKAAFTYTVSGRTVTVTNKSTSPDMSKTGCFYSFGGTYVTANSSGVNTWTFGYNGKFKIELYLSYHDSLQPDSTYKLHCEDTVKHSVTVAAADTSFSMYDSLASIVGYIGAGINDYRNYLNYKFHWDFGDGVTTDSDGWTSHLYKKAGTYSICLRVEDTVFHVKDSSCRTVKISFAKCLAVINYSANLKEVHFSSLGYNLPDYKIIFPNAKFFWDFGDGLSDTGLVVNHTYSKGGSYNVNLKMTNNGDTCDASKTIYLIGCSAEWGSYSQNIRARDVGFYVSNYSPTAKYFWDFGDGDTSHEINTVHTYKVAGSYKVKLTVKDGSENCDLTRIIHTGKIDIWGKVLLGVDSTECARVWLIKFNTKDSSLMAVDSYDISGWNAYYFRYKDPGTYLIKAALLSCNKQYKNYLPTYFDSSLRWDSARFQLIDSNYYWAEIHMRKGNNPGGPGFIGGKVKAGANKKEGDPMSHVEILLLDVKDNPVAYTYSMPNGSFEFKNIPYGTYKVYAEVLGLPTSPSIITINAGHPADTNSIVIINTTSVVTGIQYVSFSSQSKDIKIYPNPASDVLNISLPPNSLGKYKITITDLTGRAMLQTQFDGGNTNKQIDLKSLQTGIYIISVDAGDGNVFKSRLVIQP